MHRRAELDEVVDEVAHRRRWHRGGSFALSETSIGRLVGRPSQSASRPVGKSVSGWVGQSVGRSASPQWAVRLLRAVGGSAGWLARWMDLSDFDLVSVSSGWGGASQCGEGVGGMQRWGLSHSRGGWLARRTRGGWLARRSDAAWGLSHSIGGWLARRNLSDLVCDDVGVIGREVAVAARLPPLQPRADAPAARWAAR